MTRIYKAQGLIHGDDIEVARAAAITHAGQAHFGGSGPVGRTCRECVFWQKTGAYMAGKPRPTWCSQYRRLSYRKGPNVPHDAHACRFFELSNDPQPLVKENKSWQEQ